MRATSFSQRSCNFASKLGRRKSTAPALPQRGAAISTNACSIKPTTTTATSTSTTPPPPPLLASRLVAVALAATFAFAPVSSFPHPAHARLEGVNKPELLPKEFTPVLDVSGFLTDGERAQLRSTTEALEKDTGVKLRILAQNYPETPGLAIKDYWGVDDDTVVFVADPNTGNILNFNVGAGIDLRVPRTFWSRLAGKYGTKSYWTKNGEAVAIVNAVGAIDECLREPVGRLQCGKVGGPYVE